MRIFIPGNVILRPVTYRVGRGPVDTSCAAIHDRLYIVFYVTEPQKKRYRNSNYLYRILLFHKNIQNKKLKPKASRAEE